MANAATLFTRGNWCNGFYELYIEPRFNSSEQVLSLLSAIWSHPTLEGCVPVKDQPFATQSRCTPREHGLSGHLYGVATMDRRSQIVCGTYACDQFLGFYFPLAALSHLYDIGGYPFGHIEGVPQWRFPVDEYLRTLADWTFAKQQFELGIIGFEIGNSITADSVRSDGIPSEHPDGILWNENGELRWYAPNLP